MQFGSDPVGGGDAPDGEPDGEPTAPASDLFQGFTVIVAEDPDAWARSVAERVGARVISSPFEAEQVVSHRAAAAEAKELRARLAEAQRLQTAIATATARAVATPPPPPPAPPPPFEPYSPPLEPAPPTPSPSPWDSPPEPSPAPWERPPEPRSAIAQEAIGRAQRLADQLAEARLREQTARERLAQASGDLEASRRIQASLEAAPTQLREAAAAVLHTSDQARGLKEALGPRPIYDAAAHRKVTETQEEHDDASDHYEFLRKRISPLLAVALGLVLVALSLRLAVGAVVAIAIVLVVALGFLVRRVINTRQRAKEMKQVLETTLAGAGAERADQLEQRQIEWEAWERRAREAAAADEAWGSATRQWQALAGPEAEPDRVEELIADLERARHVHERLSVDRTAHIVADEGVGRLEQEWNRLMAEFGLSVPASEPRRALEALAARAGVAAPTPPSPPSPFAPAPPPEPVSPFEPVPPFEPTPFEPAPFEPTPFEPTPAPPSPASPEPFPLVTPAPPEAPGDQPAAAAGPSAEEAELRAQLNEVLDGDTLQHLAETVERLGPDKDTDDRPILLADPLRNLSGPRKRALLIEFEKASRLAPVVLVTADPEIQTWAASR